MSKQKHQDRQPQQTATDEAAAFASRRRVIKGLASTVPVALTLTNGAAMANTSSHQCLTNAGATPPPDCSTNQADLDGWANAQVTAPPGTGSDKYCVAYADEPTPGTLQITGYNYDYTDAGGNQVTLFVDQNGNTVNGGAVTGNPLTASCGSSFV